MANTNKEVQKQLRSSNLNLYIFQQIKAGKRPSQISKNLSMSKTAFQYYLTSLKKSGFIKKIGYGVWEILKEYDPKEVQNTTKVANHNLDSSKKEVRGHAFQFKLQIPKIQSWKNREKLLLKNAVSLKSLKLGGIIRGQAIEIMGLKVWLCDNSLVIYQKSSYMADSSKDSQKYAIYDMLRVVKRLEGLLGANFSFKGKYKFKVCRQHYSLVKNALAQQYDRENKKLQVYNDKGLWFLIDNSFNLHEAETVHAETSVEDNQKVQNFFNGLKETKGYTPQMVVNTVGSLADNFHSYSQHIKSHIKAVQDLGNGVTELVGLIKKLKLGSKGK